MTISGGANGAEEDRVVSRARHVIENPGEPRRNRNSSLQTGSRSSALRLVTELSVTKLAELSGFSKSYISQVRHGKCPPSQRLLDALAEHGRPGRVEVDYLERFLQSREAIGVSPSTLRYYWDRLGKFVSNVQYQTASRQDIDRYLNTIPPNENGLGSRHASYRAIRVFYRWLST